MFLGVRVFNSQLNCRFRYESNHLLDMSAEEDNELPPVKTLLEVLNANTHVHCNIIFRKFTAEENMFVCFYDENHFYSWNCTFVVLGCLERGGAEFGRTCTDSLQSPAAPKPAACPQKRSWAGGVCYCRWAPQWHLGTVSQLTVELLVWASHEGRVLSKDRNFGCGISDWKSEKRHGILFSVGAHYCQAWRMNNFFLIFSQFNLILCSSCLFLQRITYSQIRQWWKTCFKELTLFFLCCYQVCSRGGTPVCDAGSSQGSYQRPMYSTWPACQKPTGGS